MQSLLAGVVFAGALLAHVAVVARDGRRPVTDWLDPLLAGATLTLQLLALGAALVVRPRLPRTRVRDGAVTALAVAPWVYLLGEVLSNTVTVGEPPADVGSLVEIASGAVVGVAVAVLLAAAARRPAGSARRGPVALRLTVGLLAIGMSWWFTHPIDQGTPGTPRCVPGNPLYNAFHGPCP